MDREIKKPHENPSIGALLCTENDKEVVEIALSRNISPALIAEYETMSGELNYVHFKVEEVAQDLKFRAETTTLKTFAYHLLQVADVLRDVDKYLSGDCKLEIAEKSIRNLFGEDWKRKELTLLQQEAKALIVEMNELIKKE